MNFERYCGIASAAMILLVLALSTTLGLYGPLWSKLSGSDLLTASIAVVGWLVTVSLGLRAFRLSQHQIALAQEQIKQQQAQIAETREEVRKAAFARLDREFYQFARDVDRLLTAKGYLGTFTARFPVGRLDGWARDLYSARTDAADFVSHSAITAPFGHGERISTVMTKVQRLGELLAQTSRGYMPDQEVLQYYDPIVKSAIEGLRSLESQISDDIPLRQAQLVKIADERDSYAST